MAEAEEELDFVRATFDRALLLDVKLAPLPPSSSGEALEQDRVLTRQFEQHVADFRYELGAPEFSLRQLRAAALGAYVSARMRFDLRRPVETEPLELLPFDAQDAYLASL